MSGQRVACFKRGVRAGRSKVCKGHAAAPLPQHGKAKGSKARSVSKWQGVAVRGNAALPTARNGVGEGGILCGRG